MSNAALKVPPVMSVEEFLAWSGDGHAGKFELVDGIVRAMAHASGEHAIVQGNIVTALNNHLRRSKGPYRAGTEAPIIPPLGKRANARAPDISVTCTPVSEGGVFEDPVLIVEVLSPSNEAETWESIRALAGLASLREIMVVQSTRVEAQVFRRDATGAWPADPVTSGAGDVVRLGSIELELPTAELYRDTYLAGN